MKLVKFRERMYLGDSKAIDTERTLRCDMVQKANHLVYLFRGGFVLKSIEQDFIISITDV